MPRKFRKFRRRPRRRYRKKNRAPNGFMAIAKVGKFIPPTMMVKLRYVERITLDVGAGGIPANYYFRMNSIFDPNYSGVGRVFYGKTQIESLGYQKYMVLGAKINIKSIVPNPSQIASTKHNQLIISSTMKSSPSTIMASTEEVLENGETRYHFTNQTYMKSHTNYFSAKKFFGVKDVKDNEQLGSYIADNPNEICYCRVSAHPMEKNLDAFPANVLITIDALVYYHDRQVIAN